MNYNEYYPRNVSTLHNYCGTFVIASFITEQIINKHADETFINATMRMLSKTYPHIEIDKDQLSNALCKLTEIEQNLFIAYALFEETKQKLIDGKEAVYSHSGLTTEELKRYLEIDGLNFQLYNLYDSDIFQDVSDKLNEKNTRLIQGKLCTSPNTKKSQSLSTKYSKEHICVIHESGAKEQQESAEASKYDTDFYYNTHFIRLLSLNYTHEPTRHDINQFLQAHINSRHTVISHLLHRLVNANAVRMSKHHNIFFLLDQLRDLVQETDSKEAYESFNNLLESTRTLKSATHRPPAEQTEMAFNTHNHLTSLCSELIRIPDKNLLIRLYDIIKDIVKAIDLLIAQLSTDKNHTFSSIFDGNEQSRKEIIETLENKFAYELSLYNNSITAS